MPKFDFYTTKHASSTLSNSLFHSQAYIDLYGAENLYSFYLREKATAHLLALVHFEIIGQKAISFSKAPFGSVLTCGLTLPVLSTFLAEIESVLKKEGAETVWIKSWPSCYDLPDSDLLQQLYLQSGYFLAYTDFNFHLDVSDVSIEYLLLKPERKRLRKCIREGLEFSQWVSPDVAQTFQLLSSLRAKKDIPINITQEALEKSFTAFPEIYFVFTVKIGQKTIGISVCVEVNKNILYHFALANDPDYNMVSPSVLLYAGIYRFCQEKGYSLFDFGTASIQGKKQEGLYSFKEKLGGQLTFKHVWTKQLV